MFALTISICSTHCGAIKADLRRQLPNVKSSHRCEAMARGLGFRTYASLLSRVATAPDVNSQVRGDLFLGYLVEHGVGVSSEPLYRACAKAALCAVAEQAPQLTSLGIGIGGPRRKTDGQWEDWQDRNAKFTRCREDLVADRSVEPFLASLALLGRVAPTATIRSGSGSYRLKHVAENYTCTYPEGGSLGPVYVPNGVFIAAALHAGFRMRTHYESLNAQFNISKRCIDDLDCETRPHGACAQDRRRKLEARRSWSRWGAYTH